MHDVRMLVEGEDVIEDKTDHNCLEMLWVDLPLPEREVPIKEVIKVPIIQPWPEDPGKADRPAQAGRGLKVKVNLPIFKEEKKKDVVTYCSWQWDVAIFCHSG